MRRRVILVLVAFALWPLAQHVLVRTQGLSPWKAFGWAMYCQPKVTAVTRLHADDARLPVSQLAPDARVAMDAHHLRWKRLGDLADPDAAGCAVLRAHPTIGTLRIVSEQRSLDPDTGLIRSRERTSVYRRDGPVCGTVTP